MPISATVTNNDLVNSLNIFGFVNPGDSARLLLQTIAPGASFTFTVQDGSSSHIQTDPPPLVDPPPIIEDTDSSDVSSYTDPDASTQGE